MTGPTMKDVCSKKPRMAFALRELVVPDEPGHDALGRRAEELRGHAHHEREPRQVPQRETAGWKR